MISGTKSLHSRDAQLAAQDAALRQSTRQRPAAMSARDDEIVHSHAARGSIVERLGT